MGVLHGLTHRHDQPRALAHIQVVVVAIIGDRPGVLEKGHDQKWAAIGRGAAVEHRADAGVIEPGENLALAQKTCYCCIGDQPALNDLQRHFATVIDDARQVDRPHSAAVDALDNIEATDAPPLEIGRKRRRRRAEFRAIRQPAGRLVIGRQQFPHFAPDDRIGTVALQPTLPFSSRQLRRRSIEGLDLLPLIALVHASLVARPPERRMVRSVHCHRWRSKCKTITMASSRPSWAG